MKLMQELLSLTESSPDNAGITWLSEIQEMLSKKGFSKDDIQEIGEWVAGDGEKEDFGEDLLAKLHKAFPGRDLDALRELWNSQYMNEGAMKDMHIDLLDAIENEFGSNDDMTQAIADYLLDGTDNKKVSEFLYDHFSEGGRMPYGTMKARDGDPDNWIADEMQKIFKKELAAVHSIKEDWGSSDWYAVFQSIEHSLKRGDSLEEAIYSAAEFYHDSMGYDDVEDAIASIKRIAKARKYDWAMNLKEDAVIGGLIGLLAGVAVVGGVSAIAAFDPDKLDAFMKTLKSGFTSLRRLFVKTGEELDAETVMKLSGTGELQKIFDEISVLPDFFKARPRAKVREFVNMVARDMKDLQKNPKNYKIAARISKNLMTVNAMVEQLKDQEGARLKKPKSKA